MLALRYFFDVQSGACLWANNDEARARFGYAVDHRALPLDVNVRSEIDRLLAWHDTYLDMDDPGKGMLWDRAEIERFRLAADALLLVLRRRLPAPHWTIDDAR